MVIHATANGATKPIGLQNYDIFNLTNQFNHTERLFVYLPAGKPNVTFAVDASVGGNCLEPYMIDDFWQEPADFDPGSGTDIKFGYSYYDVFISKYDSQ